MKTKDKDAPVVAFSGTIWEAEMVISLLENVEITAFLKDENMGTLAPWNAAAGGAGSVSVVVSNSDYDKARLIVEEYEKNTNSDK
jgi:hypothetical protein